MLASLTLGIGLLALSFFTFKIDLLQQKEPPLTIKLAWQASRILKMACRK
jgi:hypothetical protein